MTAALIGVVSASLGLLPLLLTVPQPVAARLVAGVAVAVACTAAGLTGRLRTSVTVATLLWLGTSLVGATDGPQVAVAVLVGVLLRVWCGLPELTAIGRTVLPDLAPDVAAGALAASLVLAVADARADLPAPAVLAAVAGLGALTAVAARRIRT